MHNHQLQITREILRSWDACYSDQKIARIVPPEGLSPLQILDLEIPEADRLWVMLREEILSSTELRLLACLWAERALDQYAPNADPRSREAIQVARRFARGEATQEELSAAAARAAAAAAAAAAEWAAAAAARAAAAAADAAAWAAADAADAAAWAADAAVRAARAARAADAADAAWAARAAAARAAEWAEQSFLSDVRRVLEGGTVDV